VVLAPSRLCSLDVDDVPAARQVLWEVLGVDLDALPLHFPTVVGNPERMRVMFRVPEGVELSAHKLTWPNQADPDGALFRAANQRKASAKKAAEVTRKTNDAPAESDALEEMKLAQAEAELVRPLTVLELRAGDVQDVLPPSIHPDTGQPYSWRTPLPEAGPLPELPVELLRGWQNWEVFKRTALEVCPWAPKAPLPGKPKPKPQAEQGGKGPSVVEAFNRAHDVEQLLETHGYERRALKWLYPGSTTGIPGVTVVEGTVFSHHASDPLCNGHRNDCFDVFCLLEHGGDFRAAVRGAAQVLGIARLVREQPPPVGEAQPPIAAPGSAVSAPPVEVPPVSLAASRRKGKKQDQPAAEWREQLRRNEDGGLRPELSNAYLILSHDERWRGVLAYNEFADRIEKRRLPPMSPAELGAWQDVDASKALVWLQMEWGLRLKSSATTDEAARLVAWDNRYHPVREWLERLQPWDGKPRLAGLMAEVFGADQNEYTAHIGQSLLVSAVARVRNPGCKVDEMIVLEGGQGQGKSTCIMELFGFEWHLETSEAPGAKDFYVTMQGNWVVEIAEMQSFSKADINQVKMAITRRDDKYRAPYDRHATSHLRQCVFVGSTNAEAYLRDATGARRFLPVACSKAMVGYVREWREQLWAEALHLYDTDFRWWEYPKDMATAEQDARYIEDAWEEAILDYVEGRAPEAFYPFGQVGRIDEVTVMTLLKRALQMDMARMNKAEQMRVADILRRMGWPRGPQKREPGGRRVRPYLRPQPLEQVA
jgi:predicted P-loop ATPase